MIYVLIFIVLLAIALLTYNLYRTKEDILFKLMSLPVLVLVIATLGFHYLESFGRPVAAMPKGEWNYVHHETNGKDIQLWVVDKKGSKLYVFPYNEETREQLEAADALTEQGVSVIGEFNTDKTDERLDIKEDKRTIPK